MTRRLLPALLSGLLPLSGLCAGKAGSATAQFLKLGVGARYEAMGEAAVAICDDANALRWNPANLALIQTGSLTLMQAYEAASADRQFAAFAFPVGDAGTAGVFGQSMSAGTLKETDEFGAPLGDFSPRDTVSGFGWGWAFSPSLRVGAAIEIIQSKVLHTASTLADSVGVSYNWRGVSAAAVLRDAGGKLKFDRETEEIPLTVQAGVAFRPGKSWLAALDGIFPKDAAASLGAGIERVVPLSPGMDLAFRGGYNSRVRSSPGSIQGVSAGLGWRWSFFDLDYAWAPWGDVAQTHRISMNFRFGPIPSVKKGDAALPNP